MIRMHNSIPDLKRVVLAFESHITSEIIWAINVLLLFSSNINVSLVLENQPYLVESMTNYMYYCVNNISDFFNLFKKDQEKLNPNEQKKFNFHLDSNVNRTVSLPFLNKKEKDLNLKEEVMKESEVEIYQEEVMEYELLEHVMCLLQIFRNLSLIKSNEACIIKNNRLMTLIYSLFISANQIEIKSSCLDIITNLSKHIFLKDTKNNTGLKILQKTFELVKSHHKELAEQSIECLRRLTFAPGNEEFFCKLDDDFYSEMSNLLINIKQEIRESVLEILYCVSDNMVCKSKLGKEINFIDRLIALLCSNSGDNRIQKFAACILSNLASIPYNQKLILAYEEEIFLAACLDETLTKTLMSIISG